jgi:predicted P-loop ATPase
MWIIELAEMSFLKGTTANEVKNFISRTEDYIRPPYGAIPEPFPRRAILIGTVNDEVYLSDRTGNVRYLPVKVGGIDVDRVLEDRDQLWAEAVKLFLDGSQWWLEGDEVEVAERQTRQRLPEDPIEEIVKKWILNFDPAKRPRSVTTGEVCVSALGLDKARVDGRACQRVAAALKALGFELVKVNGLRKYKTPEALMSAAREALGGFTQ